METQVLLNYLGTVMDLEKNKYIQEKTIRSINNQIKSCRNKINGNNLIIVNAAKQSNRSSLSAENVTVSKSGKWLAYLGIYYCAFMGAIILGGLTYYITRQSVALTAVMSIIGILIGGFFPLRIWRNILKKRKAAEIKKIEKIKLMDDVNIINCDTEIKNLQAAIPKLQNDCSAMQKTLKVTSETLSSYYNMNIIPIKYRSMLPICMFYDYILNKRTYSLERNPVTADIGAINMYEDEIYRGLIISKLNEAIQKLDMIRQNQTVFYERMQEAQSRTHELLNGINNNITGFRKDVNKNLDIIKYQTEQIANCEKYMAYVTYQKYMS